MTTINDYEEEANRDPEPTNRRVSVLYGDFGSRKTTTAASMVNERGLLLTTDDSWTSLLNPRHREVYSKLKITPVTGISQFEYIDFKGYDTVIWDTLSQTVDEFLDLMYDEADWAGKIREKINTKNTELKKLNVQALGAMDYRVTRDTLRPVFNKLFRETEANLIFTCQFKQPMQGLSSDQRVRPDIPAATFKVIGTRADLIGHTKAVNGKYVVDFTNNLTQLGKSRIESIEGSMNPETFIANYKKVVFG